MDRRALAYKGNFIDQVIGWVTTFLASVFATLQWWTDFGNVLLILLNVVLAILGIVLLLQRIYNARSLGRKIREVAPDVIEENLEEMGIIDPRRNRDDS